MNDPVTNLVVEQSIPDEQRIRREFFSRVLTVASVQPEQDLQNLCRAWLDVTGAEWVWLWLLHEDNKERRPWELSASVGRSGKTEELVPKDSTCVALDSHDSLAEYCAHLERPVFINQIGNWRPELAGHRYHVISADELKLRGCRSFIAVPLFSPKSSESERDRSQDSTIRKMRGLVTAHFRDESPPIPLQSEQSYLLMGHATAQTIAISFAAEQYRILSELDGLATRFLTSKISRLVEKRQEYLHEVITLIKAHLRVEYVSVFYRTRDENQIECLATTGLWDVQGNPPPTLAEARYAKSEGVTGDVFATGIPFVSKLGQNVKRPGRTSYTWRETPADVTESQLPWICYPIQVAQQELSAGRSEVTLGVVRCVGNESLLATSIPRNFDPIQMQTIHFIARQLAPVLETMAIDIERERKITVIKHDLYNPIHLIDHQADAMSRCLEGNEPLPKYWYSNIKAALVLADNLAGSLTDRQAFTPEPTYLEGDIVARVKDGLRYFAWIENRMTIDFRSIRELFPRLILDRSMIERALVNLLINAVKYGFRETCITVEGEATAGGWLLHVKNYGIGVESVESKLIFEGEYRSPRVVTLKKGLGLGLKIARSAMRRHNGDVQLTSQANPTTFTMIFPRELAANLEHRAGIR